MLLTEVAGAHWWLHGWAPDEDHYRQNLATTAWISRRYHELVRATAADS